MSVECFLEQTKYLCVSVISILVISIGLWIQGTWVEINWVVFSQQNLETWEASGICKSFVLDLCSLQRCVIVLFHPHHYLVYPWPLEQNINIVWYIFNVDTSLLTDYQVLFLKNLDNYRIWSGCKFLGMVHNIQFI